MNDEIPKRRQRWTSAGWLKPVSPPKPGSRPPGPPPQAESRSELRMRYSLDGECPICHSPEREMLRRVLFDWPYQPPEVVEREAKAFRAALNRKEE